MKVASDKFDVICKDGQGSEHNLSCFSYDEFGNEIYIETCVYNTELLRGWIGDLYYLVHKNIDVETCDVSDLEIKEMYKDVLLASVIPYANHGEATVWKYTFLKK